MSETMGNQSMTRQEVIQRAERANALLRDDLVAEVFQVLEKETVEDWKATTVLETAKREEAYRLILAMALFKGKLEAFVGDGLVAVAQQESEERRRKEEENG